MLMMHEVETRPCHLLKKKFHDNFEQFEGKKVGIGIFVGISRLFVDTRSYVSPSYTQLNAGMV
jgi:hypothetical protein